MAKVLITGGAGFIGFHLAKHLAEMKKHEIFIAENFVRGRRDGEFEDFINSGKAHLIEIDLTNRDEYTKLGDGFDHIYHLAAINGTRNFYEIPDKVLKANTLPLFYLLDWIVEKKRGKIVYASSSETYSSALAAFGQLPIPTPEDVPLVIDDPSNLRWSYAAGKIVGEVLLNAYGKKHGVDFSIIRYHNVYGPRMGYEHVIPQLICRAVERVDPFPLYGGDSTRTFCYIDDAIDCTIKVMESNNSNHHTFHIGQDPVDEVKILDVLGKIFEIVGWRPDKIDIKPSPQGSVNRRAPNISKAQNMLGYKPQVGLNEGIKKTYEWYKVEAQKLLSVEPRQNLPWNNRF